MRLSFPDWAETATQNSLHYIKVGSFKRLMPYCIFALPAAVVPGCNSNLREVHRSELSTLNGARPPLDSLFGDVPDLGIREAAEILQQLAEKNGKASGLQSAAKLFERKCRK